MSLTPVDYLSHAVESFPVLIIPGLRNSDDRHWQSLWQECLPHSKRIHVDDWSTPNLAAWRIAIAVELEKVKQPTVLIAHSFGTLASAAIAAEFAEKIAALFLVAPADPDKFGISQQLPENLLRVNTQVIASSNDPWMSEQKAAYWARRWGADYFRIKQVGHINSDSNLGFWLEGVKQLGALIKKAKTNIKVQTLKQTLDLNDPFLTNVS